MKKFFLFLFCLAGVYAVQAQAKDSTLQDSTLKEYVGSYKFPEGSFVTSAEISINGNMLYVSSAQGSSPLEKKAKDTFAFTNYNGMAYFFRNSEGQVAKIKVAVEDLLLEGTKDGVTAWRKQHYDFVPTKRLQGK